MADETFTIADKVADFKEALENSYTIRLQEEQIVILKANLERAKKDNGGTSNQYSIANYELINAELKLTQLNDKLKSDYDSIVNDIAETKSNLRLEQQKLEDSKVALSQATVRMSLGMISKLEIDDASTSYQTQVNAVENKQIDLFNVIRGYEWFLKGMPSTL